MAGVNMQIECFELAFEFLAEHGEVGKDGISRYEKKRQQLLEHRWYRDLFVLYEVKTSCRAFFIYYKEEVSKWLTITKQSRKSGSIIGKNTRPSRQAKILTRRNFMHWTCFLIRLVKDFTSDTRRDIRQRILFRA